MLFMDLKTARLQAGLTIKELAALTKKNQSTIWRIENGKRRASPELALEIEKALPNLITHTDLLYPNLQHIKKSAPHTTLLNKFTHFFLRRGHHAP